MTITSASYADGTYAVQAVLSDPSGVDAYSITLDGEERASGNGNWERNVTVSEQIDVGVFDGVTRFLENNELRVAASDRHGNERSRLAYSSADVFVEAIEAHGLSEWLTATEVTRLGVLSGATQGAGEVLGQLTSLIKDPKAFLEELANVDKYAKLLNNLESLPGLLVVGFRGQMNASKCARCSPSNSGSSFCRTVRSRPAFSGLYGGKQCNRWPFAGLSVLSGSEGRR